MLPKFGYITGRLREAQDPKLHRCKSFEEVDECHREIGIISGYRDENCSIPQALLSLFKANNETVNFWTHFIPTLYFLWLFASLEWSMALFNDPFLFPFVCYMVTTCGYPFISCLAHAFSCLSLRVNHIFFYLDYAMISLYSWGVAVLYYSYSFPPDLFRGSIFSRIYLPFASVNAIACTLIACYSRHAKQTLIKKVLRLFAFTFPYLWVSLPLLWRLMHCNNENDVCHLSAYHHKCQFIGVLLASFFYGSHIPERLAPGRFDIVGHSHNLLHLFGIIATYQQLKGALIDLQGRRVFLESIQWTAGIVWTEMVTPVIVLANVCIVVKFSLSLNNCKENFEKRKLQ